MTFALALATFTSASAQSTFEHAQTRIQEGMHEFFVRPVVAELQMIEETRQLYGPFIIYPGMSLQELTADHLENAKTNAAYKAAEVAGADIILGATFYVVSGDNKTKGLLVTVKGYPAKYVGFHKYGDQKLGTEDARWVGPLQEGFRSRRTFDATDKRDKGSTKAVGSQTR